MSHRVRLLVGMGVVGILLAVLLLTISIDIGANSSGWWNGGSDSSVELGRGDPQESPSKPRLFALEARKILSPDSPYAEQVQEQFANYDRIVVEVHRDGSLSVLGEVMPMDAFRSLLGGQQQEGIDTLVAIRPEDDCVYRHIDHVIRLCDDLGVPHLMVSAAVSSAAVATPTSSG